MEKSAESKPPVAKLLHIEDEKTYQEMVSRRLKDYFTIDHADSMADGIKKARLTKYDAILLDPGLHDTDRDNAIKVLKEIVSDPAIVILSGFDDEAWTREQIKNCASGVLLKGRDDLQPLPFASQITRAICTHRAWTAIDLARRIGDK